MADTYYDPKKFALLQVDWSEEMIGSPLNVPEGPLPTRPIQVPIAVVLGHFERLTDEELEEHITDLQAERDRRPHD